MDSTNRDITASIDWLCYRAYVANRTMFPHVDPVRWMAMFPDALHYEELFRSRKIITEENYDLISN